MSDLAHDLEVIGHLDFEPQCEHPWHGTGLGTCDAGPAWALILRQCPFCGCSGCAVVCRGNAVTETNVVCPTCRAASPKHQCVTILRVL